MGDPEAGQIRWSRPDPAAIIPLDGFRVPDTLRRRVRSGRFTITTNLAFSNVIRACAVAAPGSGSARARPARMALGGARWPGAGSG